MLPRHCWAANNSQMTDYAYAHDVSRGCNNEVHMCSPGASVCRYKAPIFARWRWHTRRCALQTFNAKQFSAAVGNRSISFVGDSLMVEQFFSLQALLQSEMITPSGGHYFETTHGGKFEVIGTWHLIGEGREGDPSDKNGMFAPRNDGWRVILGKADILIINTGHHWHRVDPEFSSYQRMVENVLHLIARNFQGTDVIFRTSTWGHSGCSNFTKPFTFHQLSSKTLPYDPYSWMKPIFSERAWPALAALHLPHSIRFHVVNTSLTMLRGDGHLDMVIGKSSHAWEDCLHNCLPGPADYWNWLLFNLLTTL